MGTKNNPGKFDCYAAAGPDEPMFILLGRDRLGASLVQLWAHARQALDEDPEKITEARQCVDAMKQELYVRHKKQIDVLDLIPFELLAGALRRRGATVNPAPHGGNQTGRSAFDTLPDDYEAPH